MCALCDHQSKMTLLEIGKAIEEFPMGPEHFPVFLKLLDSRDFNLKEINEFGEWLKVHSKYSVGRSQDICYSKVIRLM